MTGSFPKCPVGEKEAPDKMSGMDFGLANALISVILFIIFITYYYLRKPCSPI